MTVAGTYACTTKTPMGDQQGTFTVVPEGENGFTGAISGPMGSMDVKDGTIEGNTLKWQMKMTMPMPIDLDCRATIEGDSLDGEIKAGMFGTMKLTGTRQG
ncbi:hypothetical protein B2G71_06565 [Novosphingobium sp. PC22D]|uniref:hypothetical protein n=1 Tax=Novosphingobium sp. PC22D TaxID=1962403 RepID=UPI000BF247C5|nr:hypothetical protein [Novosphingobium sp. PC22D]PEQ13954.1 hypothetical protein B2G71_06565 [Novosphingobium sp. PC22D]